MPRWSGSWTPAAARQRFVALSALIAEPPVAGSGERGRHAGRRPSAPPPSILSAIISSDAGRRVAVTGRSLPANVSGRGGRRSSSRCSSMGNAPAARGRRAPRRGPIRDRLESAVHEAHRTAPARRCRGARPARPNRRRASATKDPRHVRRRGYRQRVAELLRRRSWENLAGCSKMPPAGPRPGSLPRFTATGSRSPQRSNRLGRPSPSRARSATSIRSRGRCSAEPALTSCPTAFSHPS